MEPSRELSPIVQRLRWEAEHRPAEGLKAEQVFDALGRAGVALTGTRQYLGGTMKASYCAGGTTPEGLAIAVCEYSSSEAAEEGKAFMEQRFAAMTPHARRIVQGQTLLTIAQPASNRSGTEVVTRAVETFTSL